MPFPHPFPSDSPFYPIVVTLAGQGRKGFVDGHRLHEAYFCGPLDACHLPDFSLIISDGRNNCLRRLDLQTDAVTTLATHAFLGPRSPVVIDGGAAVVLCDSGHNKVRMVQLAPEDPTLVVQDCTIAGTGRHGHVDGPANSAAFARPLGLCVIHDGSILVADSQNHAIRRIAGRPGRQGLFVTTIIGGGAAGRPGFVDGDESTARLNCPTALSVDPRGTVLIIDAGNTAIRALHLPPGRDASAARGWALTTVCGDGRAGYSDGPAAGSARLREPVALAMGGDGELLVSDAGNHAVRAFLPAVPNTPALPYGGGLFRVAEVGGAVMRPEISHAGSASLPPGTPSIAAACFLAALRVGDLSSRAMGPGAHWTIVGPAETLRVALASQGAPIQRMIDVAAAEDREARVVAGGDRSPGAASPGIAASAWMHSSSSLSPGGASGTLQDGGGSGSRGRGAGGGGGGLEPPSRLASRAPPVHYVPYHDPAAVLAAHERYCRVITVAGGAPLLPAQQTLDVGSVADAGAPPLGKGYADGHATAQARFQRPHGLCVLSGGVGSPVVVLDSGNDMVRLLVSRAAMDLQPVVLRPVVPAPAVALARRIIIERRAELIAAAPRDPTLSPHALVGSLRRIGWPEQQKSPRSAAGDGVSRVPSAATTASGLASARSATGGGAAGSERRAPAASAAPPGSAPPSGRVLGHTASSARRISQRSNGSAAGGGISGAARAAAAATALVDAAAPPRESAAAGTHGRGGDGLDGGGAAPPPHDSRMTLEEIANAADFASAPPAQGPEVAAGAPPPPSVQLTRADPRPPPPAGSLALPVAASPSLATSSEWHSAPPRQAFLHGAPPPPQLPTSVLRPSLGAAHSRADPGGLLAASAFAARHQGQHQQLRSAPPARPQSASASRLRSAAADQRLFQGASHEQLQANFRSQPVSDREKIFRAAADLVSATAMAAAADGSLGGSGDGRGAHYARPTSAQRQRVAATPPAGSGGMRGGGYTGTTGPSSVGVGASGGRDAASRHRGPLQDPSRVRLRVTDAGGTAIALPGDAAPHGAGGAPLSHDSHLAGTHTAAFWSHHELCPDRNRVVVNEWFSSRDALAHEDADAAGAVVQALLLSDTVGGGPSGGRRRGSASSVGSGLLSARFTRHTASSASSLRARGHKVVRAAPAFINVSAVVARKLSTLRATEAGRGASDAQQQQQQPREDWGGEDGDATGELGGDEGQRIGDGEDEDGATFRASSHAPRLGRTAASSRRPASGAAERAAAAGAGQRGVRPSSAAHTRRPVASGGAAAVSTGAQTDTTGGGDLSLLAVRSFHPAFGE